MKTIVWRPGFVDVRVTTSQQGVPITDSPPATPAQVTHDATAGQMQKSIPSTLVVADAGDVYNQILAYGGDCEVVIDDSIAPAVIPAGQVWPGFGIDPVTGQPRTSGAALLSIRGATRSTLLFVPDKAGILGLLSAETITILSAAVTAPAFGFGSVLRLKAAVLSSELGALVPVAQTADGATLDIYMEENSAFDNTAAPAHPILQMGTTTGLGSTLRILAVMQATLGGLNAITQKTAAGVVNFKHDLSVASGYFAAQNPALVGVTDVQIDGATGAGGAYTPGAPADWVGPVPTTIQQALDRLAAAGGVTPVP